eukprot:SAG31_NODE_2247_length_6094_cov_6.426522_3_plen_168_part_00
MNLSELRALVSSTKPRDGAGCNIQDAGVEGQGGTAAEVIDLLRGLFCSGGLLESAPPTAMLAITDGPAAAYVATRGQKDAQSEGEKWAGKIWRVHPPILDEGVVNPIGAGDTVSGVMLCALAKGADPPTALARGLAAASASCLSIRGAGAPPGHSCFFASVTTVENS